MNTKRTQLVSRWHALYTFPRHEKKVLELLEEKGIETYLPMVTTLKQYSDRKKMVTEPLIKSYIFVKVSEKDYYEATNTPGIVAYVRFDGKAAQIPDWQIQAMKTAVDQKVEFELTNKKYKAGEQVLITSGPMLGQQGEVVRTSGGKKKLILRIGELGFVMELGMESVQKV